MSASASSKPASDEHASRLARDQPCSTPSTSHRHDHRLRSPRYAEIARAVHTGLMLAVWVIGGVLTMLGALSLAELGAAMPEAGGIHVHQPRLRATLGLPLRLDALHRRDLRLDRDARGRVPDLPRRLRAADPHDHEDRRTRRDRAPDVDQHHRRQERRAGRELPDGVQGRRPDRDGRRHLPPARAAIPRRSSRRRPSGPSAAAVGASRSSRSSGPTRDGTT